MSETLTRLQEEELQQAAAELFDPIELSQRAGTRVVRLAHRWWVLRRQDRAERREWRILLEQVMGEKPVSPEVAEPTVPLVTVPEGSDAWRDGRYRFKRENARFPYWVERVPWQSDS